MEVGIGTPQHILKTAILNGRLLYLSDIWQCLEAFFIVIWRGGDKGIERVEAGDFIKHPTMHRTALPHRELSGPKCQ